MVIDNLMTGHIFIDTYCVLGTLPGSRKAAVNMKARFLQSFLLLDINRSRQKKIISDSDKYQTINLDKGNYLRYNGE